MVAAVAMVINASAAALLLPSVRLVKVERLAGVLAGMGIWNDDCLVVVMGIWNDDRLPALAGVVIRATAAKARSTAALSTWGFDDELRAPNVGDFGGDGKGFCVLCRQLLSVEPVPSALMDGLEPDEDAEEGILVSFCGVLSNTSCASLASMA